MLTSKPASDIVVTMLLVFLAFQFYNYTFSRLTDFEQIEPELLLPMELTIQKEMKPQSDSLERQALVTVFGQEAIELRENWRSFHWKLKNDPNRLAGWYVYWKKADINPKDRHQIICEPFTLVILKTNPKPKTPEDSFQIYSVRGEKAVLIFENELLYQDLWSPNRPEPIAGWVEGSSTREVQLTDHRSTPRQPKDDIVLFAQKLNYDQRRHVVWDLEKIHLSLQAEEIDIYGKGLEIALQPLATNENTGNGNPWKAGMDIKTIQLYQNVTFNLKLQASQANLFGTPAATNSSNLPAPPQSESDQQRQPVVVTARGSTAPGADAAAAFRYDFATMQANFHQNVQVRRSTFPIDSQPSNTSSGTVVDELMCEHLKLQFSKQDSKLSQKNSSKPEPNPSSTASDTGKIQSLDKFMLQSITATGPEVLLLFPSESLYAYGTRLFHDSVTGIAELRGENGIFAGHDSSAIQAKYLLIEQDPGNSRAFRSIRAYGPEGYLEVREKSQTHNNPRDVSKILDPSGNLRMTIRWNGELSILPLLGSNDRQVTIKQDVELELNQEDMILRGKQLVVVLKAEESNVAHETKSNKSSTDLGKKYVPLRIEATDEVTVVSPKMNVSAQHKLVVDIVHRKSKITKTNTLSQSSPGIVASAAKTTANLAPPTQKVSESPIPASATASKFSSPNTTVPLDPPGNPQIRKESDPANQFDLRARNVVLVVERVDETTPKPLRAVAAGEVLIIQRASNTQAEPLRLGGDNLEFERSDAGDKLTILASPSHFAFLRSPEMELTGEKSIMLDEAGNTVVVSGPGWLRLQSQNSFTGAKLSQPTELRIQWQRKMTFDGLYAIFNDEVIANQLQSKIKCHQMEVRLDSRLQFQKLRQDRDNHPAKTNKTPTIDKVDCTGSVQLDHFTLDRSGNPEHHALLEAASLFYDHSAKTAVADGPGILRNYQWKKAQLNQKGELVPPSAPLELTRIEFQGRMNGTDISKTAHFYERVKILNSPVFRDQEVPNLNQLPREAKLIQAEKAEIQLVETSTGNGYDFQSYGNVKFNSQIYGGNCDLLSYDRAKDKIVLNSEGSNKVRLYREQSPGVQQDTAVASRIEYWPKSNRLESYDSDGVIFNVTNP